jgi:hypothetical protein
MARSRIRGHRRARLAAVAAAACVVLGAFAASAPGASAAFSVVNGISDQNLGQWTGDYQDTAATFTIPFDDFFAQTWVGGPTTHLQYARFVTAPDTVGQGGECLANLTTWFEYVTQQLHLTPVISVWNVAEGGCANNGKPSTSAYTTDVTQLLTYLDSLSPGTPPAIYLEAWNEPNSSGVTAAQAAAYWIAANAACQTAGCTAIAGDLVDNDPDQGSQPFDPGCDQPLTWTTHLAPYEAQYVAALAGAQPAIWGFHPYFAVNCEQDSSVTTFEAGLPTPPPGGAKPQVWFTETAAWECVKGVVRGPTQQAADASYLVNDLVPATSPSAVFYYEMAAPNYVLNCSKYADSELFEAPSSPGPLLARPAAYAIYGPDTTLGALTGPPSAVTETTATFNATVDLGGLYGSSYHFDYGPTQAYGSQTPEQPLDPGLTQQQVSASVSGLTPGAAYDYQLVVTDDGALTDPTVGSVTAPGGNATMAPVTVSASAATAATGSSITVSWSGISNPGTADWVGLYEPGAADGSYTAGFYADSCTQTSNGVALGSGSCTFAMPQAAGTYELRLYGSLASGLLTASGSITAVPPPPVENAAPQISGGSAHHRAFAGQTLACSSGVWANSPVVYAYQWSSDGVALAGATGTTYVVLPRELGNSLTCSVIASNAGGSGGSAVSGAVAVMRPPPVSDSAPSIKGHALIGARLLETHARWSNAPTAFGYQWQRCNARGGACRAIAGAKARAYALASADAGSTIRVLETARNASGAGAPARSRATGVVARRRG